MMEFLGSGIYNVPAVARILHVSQASVHRWAFGYRRRDVRYDPTIDTHLPELEGRRALTFLELVELFTINEMRRHKVPWKKIRGTFDYFSRVLETGYPFATDRWFADAGGVYWDRSDSEELVEVSGGGQMALRHALLPYLHQLDFEEGFARRWFPRGRSVPIVLDPEVSFGAPVVAGTGIQTATLSGMIEAGETAESVAWWYRLGIPLVDAAVHFERSLSAA